MVKAWLLILLAVMVLCTFDLFANRPQGDGRAYNAERSASVKWRFMNEAEARAVCIRPANMITTGNQDCSRVPTEAIKYCPFP